MGISKLASDFFTAAKDMASNKNFREYAGEFLEDLKLNDASQEALDAAMDTIKKRTGFFTELTDDSISEVVKKTGMPEEELAGGLAKLRAARKAQDFAGAKGAAAELDTKTKGSAFTNLVINSYNKHSNNMDKFMKFHNFVPANGIPQIKTREALFENKPENKINSMIHRFVENGGYLDRKITDGTYIVNGMKKYLDNEDPSVNRHRLEAIVGGYFVAANGIRLVKGGSPFRNEYGENDIAGVPFF